MSTVIIKYNAGNVYSVYSALQRLGTDATVSDDPEVIRAAERVIFPGVGHAASAMNFLKQKGLNGLLPQLKQPVLGICLGMQLFARHSMEGDTNLLNIMAVDVLPFEVELKIPHMGWNSVGNLQSPLFNGIEESSYFYFVHSYYLPVSEYTIAKTEYGIRFSAAVQKDNFYAVQFHPEKSATAGERLLKNFLELEIL